MDFEMHEHDTKAVCRGCGLELRGKAYYLGGHAFHPNTGAQAKVNYYGGYVCSESCDRRAHLELEQSMPGHGGQRSLAPNTSRWIEAKWASR
jgi:hypothetical protein